MQFTIRRGEVPQVGLLKSVNCQGTFKPPLLDRFGIEISIKSVVRQRPSWDISRPIVCGLRENCQVFERRIHVVWLVGVLVVFVRPPPPESMILWVLNHNASGQSLVQDEICLENRTTSSQSNASSEVERKRSRPLVIEGEGT
jgi:hypothetical protein